jgi:hypothetical protein
VLLLLLHYCYIQEAVKRFNKVYREEEGESHFWITEKNTNRQNSNGVRSKQQSWADADADADEDGESPYSDDGESTIDNGVDESKGGDRSSSTANTTKVCCTAVFTNCRTVYRALKCCVK